MDEQTKIIKQEMITLMKEEVKDIYDNTSMYTHFSLSVVVHAQEQLIFSIKTQKNFMKSDRPLAKMLTKNLGTDSLAKHDAEFARLNKQIHILKNIDQYSFLIGGKNKVKFDRSTNSPNKFYNEDD